MLKKYMDAEDDILVERTLLGDGDAYEALVLRHEKAVKGTAFRVTGNQFSAEDAAQDAFVTAWMKLDSLRERGVRVDAVDALTLACQAGSAKAVNLVLLGRLSRSFPDIPVEKWMDAIGACVKPRFVDMNKTAFTLGRESGGAEL